MGAAVSQELVDRIQGHGFNQAVRDPEVSLRKPSMAETDSSAQVKAFIENVAWPQSSQDARNFLNTLMPKRDRLKPILDLNSISIPAPDALAVQQWSSPTSQSNLPTLETSTLGAYTVIRDLTNAPTSSVGYCEMILRRMHCCILYLLKLESHRDDFRRKGVLTRAISGKVEEQEGEISANISLWTTAGANFCGLSSALGGYGVILVLPSQISRNV